MLDLQQLTYFVTVARLESIARAAEILHISQSPLSRQIIALEAQLGLELFVRHGKRLKLSALGRRFLAECHDLLASATQLEQLALQQAQGDVGWLNVAYVESAVRCGVVQRALQRLKVDRPSVRVHLQPLRTDAQFEALRLGNIDLGFVHRPVADRLAGRCKLVACEPYVLALPVGHPLAAIKTLPVAQLTQQAFVFVSQQVSPLGHALMLQACRQAGFDPQVQHEVSDPSIALSLVADGLGLAIVQASMASVVPSGVVLRPMLTRFALQLEVHAVISRHASAMALRLFDLS